MEELLFSLEDSALGMMVSSSLWGYPIVLSLHALGMATVVGISLMLCFRLMGVGATIPCTAMLPYWRVAIIGFVINLLSGIALFTGSASSLFSNPPFLIKIVLVIVALLLTRRLVRRFYRDEKSADSGGRLTAALTSLVWLSALVAGRLIGYVL